MQVAEIQFLGIASGPPVVIVPYSLPETKWPSSHHRTLPVGWGHSPVHLPVDFQRVTWRTTATWPARRATSDHHNVQFIDAGYYQLNITNSAGYYNVYPGGGADQNLVVVAGPRYLPTAWAGHEWEPDPVLADH